VAEIQGHGGTENMKDLLARALEVGARLAEPGEFSRRAFEHGKIDLVRAEAVLGLVKATNDRAARIARRQLHGELGAAVRGIYAGARGLLADIEADIDFPDADLEVGSQGSREQEVFALEARARTLGSTYALGRAVEEGIVVALAGPVNAGKSSLFNALCGQERALTSAEPGTTRDFIEVRCEWFGVPVTLIDTAGRREAAGDLEKRGQEMAASRMQDADLVVELHDTDESPGPGDEKTLPIVSKADLLPRALPDAVLATSARTGQGLERLKKVIVERVIGRFGEEGDPLVVTSERQRQHLLMAADALGRAGAALSQGGATEVVAMEIRAAAFELGAILGEEVYEGMLDELFQRFCIGK
jgi:tRNA modification GTPase